MNNILLGLSQFVPDKYGFPKYAFGFRNMPVLVQTIRRGWKSSRLSVDSREFELLQSLFNNIDDLVFDQIRQP